MVFVFVFGSTRSGTHASGAALYARRFFGAKMGVGEGPVGRSYAIPVRGNPTTPLPLYVVKQNIERFYAYVAKHPRKQFRVARITLPGYTDAQMVNLFNHPPENCTFDPRWAKYGLPAWEKPKRGTLPDR